MDMKRIPVRRTLALILSVLGAAILLAACSNAIPFIPITGLDTLKPTVTWQRVIMGIIGGILILGGFALAKIFVQLVGFLGGGILGIYLVETFLPNLRFGSIVGFFVCGLIGIGLTLTATHFSVFVAGALTGSALAQQIWPFIEKHPAPTIGLILSAVIGGLLTLWLFDFWVAALTSAIGAILLGLALNLSPLYWLIFFAAGILVQTMFTRGGKDEKKVESEKA